MTNLTDKAMQSPELSPYNIICLYGEFGKRKTTTACSLIQSNGLLISSDNSWKVLNRTQHKDLLDKTTIVRYDGLSQLEHIEYEGFDTIIFDTFGKMVDNYLDILLDNADWGGRYREKLSSKEKSLSGLSVPAPIDYRVTRDQFRPHLNRIMNLPAHKIFTFHVNDPIEGLSADTTRKPRIPASTWSMIAELADIIGWLRGGRKGFTVSVDENSLAYVGKSRIDGIEGEMKQEDFINVYANSIR